MKRIVLHTMIVFLLFVSAQALSQANSAAIRGVVVDEAGNTIPGVSIVLTEASTRAAVRTVLTYEKGAYAFENLPAGNYTISAVLRGFNSVDADVKVADGTRVEMNFTLRIANGGRGGIIPIPPAPPRNRDITIRADNVTNAGALTYYRGHIEMITQSTVVRADELDFDTNTQRADVRGNVTVQVLPLAQQR